MTRRLLFVAVLFLIAGLAHAQQLGPVDWIFLVDTSKSMRGVGGTKDIWRDVKASIHSFVREANAKDTVAIYAFDRDVRKLEAASRDDVYGALLQLDAEGNRTHLGAAIAKGLEHAVALPRDPTRTRAVVLFTDGKEDVKGIANPTPVEANVDRVGDSYVFLVSMGEHEPKLDAFAATAPRTEVLKAPTPEAIRDIAREIRTRIKPPPPLPTPPPVVPETRPEPPEPSSPRRLLIALSVLFVLLVLAVLFILHRHRKLHHLEGELEILRPATAPDAAFVGLPTLRSNEVALSAILPIDLGGSDARLFVRRRAGKKKVWISARGGTLRINDVETPESALYDADTIEIGDAKLRFNRVGDERHPEESL